MSKATVRFGNGLLNGGKEVWETLMSIIPEGATVLSVSSHDGIWEAVIQYFQVCQFCDRPLTLLQEHKEGVCLDCQQGIYP